MYIPDSYLDELIASDIPGGIDLTTHVLGIGAQPGRMEYYTRDAALLCGTEEAARIFGRFGCTVAEVLPSGSMLAPGDVFVTVEGPAAGLHMGWKICLNIFEYYCALATKTRQMVDAVHAVNPLCEVLSTRKLMPGTKPFDVKALTVGGAFPHRLGLSETVLVFDHHLIFYGGLERFIADLPQLKAKVCEKKLFVESSVEDAARLVEAGVDGVQLDKVAPEQVAQLVPQLKAINPHVTLIAAGGVNLGNAAEYAATGVDGLATTCLHFAKPLDMSVCMEAL